MKKRGQLTLLAIIDITIGISIFFLLAYVGVTWGNGERYVKLSTAKDTSLIIDTLYTKPGNAYIAYPTNISKFAVKLIDDQIDIFKVQENIAGKKQEDPTLGRYTYVRVGEESIDKEMYNIQNIVISKVGDKVEVGDNVTSLKKVATYKQDFKLKKIVLDISEETKKNTTKLEKVKEIIRELVEEKKVYLSKNLNEFGLSGKTSDEKDTLIIFSIGQEGILKVYYPYENPDSKNFAGLILNNILDKLPNIKGANIIPTDQLNQDVTIAILVESGSLNTYEISSAIKEVISDD